MTSISPMFSVQKYDGLEYKSALKKFLVDIELDNNTVTIIKYKSTYFQLIQACLLVGLEKTRYNFSHFLLVNFVKTYSV